MKDIKLNVSQSKGYEGVVLPEVKTNEEGKKLVSGRELHESLEIKTRFNDWIKRIVDYGFIENVDYTMLTQKRVTNNSKNPYTLETNCIMTLDMAKHVAMIQRSEIGMKIRNYFIECEKQLVQSKLDSYMIENPIERAKRWIEEQEEKQRLALECEAMKPKVIAYNEFMESDGTYTTTNACKMLGLKRSYVFAVLRDKGYVFKNRTEATQKGIDKGYFKQVMKSGYSTMVITPKGIDFLMTLKDTTLLQRGTEKLKCWGEI